VVADDDMRLTGALVRIGKEIALKPRP